MKRRLNSLESRQQISETNMIKKRQCFSLCNYLCSKPPKRALSSTPSSSALHVDPSFSSSSSLNDHKSFCFSLVDGLIYEGLLASAQQVIQRSIVSSTSLSDATDAFAFVRVRGVELDRGICSALIRKFVESGEPTLARDFFNEYVDSKGIVPDSNILNSMVICLARLGESDEAVRMFDILTGNDNLRPCKAACKAVVRGLLDQDRILDAVDWLVTISDAYVRLGMCGYTVLITGLCDKGYMDEAIKVFVIMQYRSGLVSTLTLLKSLFYGLCKKGRAVEAELFLEEIEKPGFYIDKVMYTSLMNAYRKDKEMKMAMRVFFKMLKRGCQPDMYSYNTLIHGFAKMGMLDKVLVLFNQVNPLGMQANVVTYNMMISNYCRQGKIDCAKTLWDAMIGDNLCPSVHCYTSLFAFFYKENKFDEFMELLKEMLNRGVFPDNFLSFILVKSRKFKELKLSLIMLREIAKQEMAIKPSFYCYTTLIIGLVKKGMINEGCFYLSKMLSVGFVPNARFYTLLINHFLRRGEVDFALRLVDLMDSNQIKPDLAFFIVTAGGICRNISRINKTWCEANKISKDQKKRLLHVLHQRPMLSSENIFRADTPEIIRYYAMRVLQVLEGIIKLQELEGIMPNLYLYNIIIYGYSWANKMENAYNHFKLMQKKGMRPNEVTFTILMDAHGRAGEIDDAVGLFNKMNECGCSPDKIAYMTLLKGICRAGRGLDAVFIICNAEEGFFPWKSVLRKSTSLSLCLFLEHSFLQNI